VFVDVAYLDAIVRIYLRDSLAWTRQRLASRATGERSGQLRAKHRSDDRPRGLQGPDSPIFCAAI
jgi:hypothetical protein